MWWNHSLKKYFSKLSNDYIIIIINFDSVNI